MGISGHGAHPAVGAAGGGAQAVAPVTIHGLRGAFITQAQRLGVPIATAVGHESPPTPPRHYSLKGDTHSYAMAPTRQPPQKGTSVAGPSAPDSANCPRVGSAPRRCASGQGDRRWRGHGTTAQALRSGSASMGRPSSATRTGRGSGACRPRPRVARRPSKSRIGARRGDPSPFAPNRTVRRGGGARLARRRLPARVATALRPSGCRPSSPRLRSFGRPWGRASPRLPDRPSKRVSALLAARR